MQTGENSIIAGKYNFMTLWLFTKLNSLIPLLCLNSCI